MKNLQCHLHTNLIGIHIAKPVLYVTVHNQLGQTKDLATQMECITETTLLSFLWVGVTFYVLRYVTHHM